MTADLQRPWIGNTPTEAHSSQFAAALAIAGVLHLILILSVGFVFPKTSPGKQASRPLEVEILRQASPSEQAPDVADAFAQVDHEGGGVEEARGVEGTPSAEPQPAIPEPPQSKPLPPPIPPFPEPILSLEHEPETAHQLPEQALLTMPAPEPAPEPTPPEPVEELPPPEPAPPPVTAAQILASRNLEIAELSARIQHNSAAYANRPRRKAISASTREYKYASYLEAWRRKVERVGNLNYPEEAKRHKMYGSLILHVAVRADGNIERVRVLRSSGFDLLDEAAVKIVELSAPFAPFPPDIRAETDILDITRTWQFLSSNRLGWDN